MSMFSAVGNTPLVALPKFARSHDVPEGVTLLAKLESCEPTSSVKDRAAQYILEDAIESGRVRLPSMGVPGTTVLEPSSGNTAVALAAACRGRGLPFIAVMPASMSVERRVMIIMLGGKVVLTPAARGMRGAIDVADALAARIGDAIVAGQFTNPANPRAHEETTGPEIMRTLKAEHPAHRLAAFVAGVGTGGTITGTARALRSAGETAAIVGVEPKESAYIQTNIAGPHGIQGIGAGFCPDNLDTEIVTEWMSIATPDAIEASRQVARLDGYAVGISAGANALAAARWAAEHGRSGDAVVTILCDTGERYLSTVLMQDMKIEAESLPIVESASDVILE